MFYEVLLRNKNLFNLSWLIVFGKRKKEGKEERKNPTMQFLYNCLPFTFPHAN